MMRFSRILAAALVSTVLAPIAFPGTPAFAQGTVQAGAQSSDADPVWAFETSDIPVDPDYRFGQLPNGLRYILRENGTPDKTAIVRLYIGSGSLDETDKERGLAHFLEHMAFNGSKKVPEGEMVKLLEREGLAFGADTNASTGFQETVYKLNLPNNRPELLDTALMLMRETASELTIAPDAVDRERGVVLAERRDRRNYVLNETEDRFQFLTPGARYADRLPIGTADVLNNASAQDIRDFYERNYVPDNAVLVIVGDYPVDEMEKRVRNYFADWKAGSDPVEPETGPVDITRHAMTDIYVDPALAERVTATRLSSWTDRPDSVAERRANLLRQIGYAIVNRRLQALARGENAPFRGAGFGTGDIFEDARQTNLIVDTADGKWRAGLDAAIAVLRQAQEFGFSEAEVAEQVAKLRTPLEDAVSASATRTNAALASAALSLVQDEQVPSTPQASLERFEAYADSITPAAVFAAMKADAAPMVQPLLRFHGRNAPEGGAQALRSAWDDAMALPVAARDDTSTAEFAYTDFGKPGTVVSDKIDERYGLREMRFANGVRLTLKKTDIRKDRISYRLSLDGGSLLNTAEDPLKTAMVSTLPAGGLGKHSQDELDSVLAGKQVQLSLSSATDAFVMSGGTTPRDLDVQLELLAAALTDPGYRTEAEERYRRNIANYFASKDATPAGALGSNLGKILSGGDPRFSLQPQSAYEALTFAKLAGDIGDRLENGAIEIALVGDFDEQAAIDAVARTLGALPPREADFRPREDARNQPFTDQRGEYLLYHTGEADQALVRMTWPTTDDTDQTESLRLELLERVVQLELQDQLREALGKAYSPSANSSTSHYWKNYGTFSLAASVDVSDVDPTRDAIRTVIDKLRQTPVDADVLDRARQPLLENYANALKTLNGWMSLADRAQSDPETLDRFERAPQLLNSVTPKDVQSAAERYLALDDAVQIIVLPASDKGPTIEPDADPIMDDQNSAQ